MLRPLRSFGLSALLAASALGATACTDGVPAETGNKPVFEDLGTVTTSVEGYAFDPEAYFLTFMACGDCPFPPLVMFYYPFVPYASVAEAQVAVYDPLTEAVVGTPGLSEAPNASWRTVVPAREEAPYFLKASGGVLPTDVDPEMGLPAPPPTEFLPTLTLTPFISHVSNVCVGLEANVVSKTGALEAVARYLTATGKPTRVEDFIDPSKYGGVVVTWLFMPGGEDGPVVRVPAFGFGIVAEPGEVLPIEWVPVEVPLPPEAAALRTDRGFMVGDPSMPMSGIGLSVVLLPPTAAGQTFVVEAALPPAENPGEDPPFEDFAREVVARPGVIQYLPNQLRGFGEPPPWTAELPMLCVSP